MCPPVTCSSYSSYSLRLLMVNGFRDPLGCFSHSVSQGQERSLGIFGTVTSQDKGLVLAILDSQLENLSFGAQVD